MHAALALSGALSLVRQKLTSVFSGARTETVAKLLV